MAESVSVADAKAHFSDYVKRAESGEVVIVTRYGKPVAAVVSADRLGDLEVRSPQSDKGSLLALTRMRGMTPFAAELDRIVADRGASREVSAFES